MVRFSHISFDHEGTKEATVPAGDFGLCVDAMPGKLCDCCNRYRGYLQTALPLWARVRDGGRCPRVCGKDTTSKDSGFSLATDMAG